MSRPNPDTTALALVSLTVFTPHPERVSKSGLAAKGSENISTISGKPGGLSGARSDLGTSSPDLGQQGRFGRLAGDGKDAP